MATDRDAVRQTAVQAAEGPLQSLWTAAHGPVLQAGEVGGRRLAVLAFSPALSEHLPLTASYPLLMGNAIYWTAAARIDIARGMNRRTGDRVALDGRHLTWRQTDQRDTSTNELALSGRYTELDRVGLWETEAGERGSAAVLSADETLLASGPHDVETADYAQGSFIFRGDLVPMLLWGILLLFMLESWLYHRYWAY